MDIPPKVVHRGGKSRMKVDKDKFDRVLGKLIATPPIRSKELVGKKKQPKPQR